jgi:2-dehydropantoate 2-reductase
MKFAMKFAILGAGGVGGYFGGKLAKAGEDVSFIARGKNFEAMQTSGLRVDSIQGNFLLEQVQATDSPESLHDVDVILLAIKAWQLDSVIGSIKSMMGRRTTILPLLNGMEHIDILRAEFGEHVLGGLCRISSFLIEPAHVSHVAINPFIAFNEWGINGSLRVSALFDVFSKIKDIIVEIPQSIELAMWEKYLLICAFSGVGSVTRAPVGVFRSIPESRAMFRRALEEVVLVANSRGVALTEKSVQSVMDRIDQTQPDMLASMQKDILEGRPSELESQTGALIHMARAADVSVPTHEFIYASLLPMEKKARGLS